MKRNTLGLLLTFLILPVCLFAGNEGDVSLINRKDAWYHIIPSYENGFISVLSHTIKQGDTQIGGIPSSFDYRENGGQEILFPFSRFSLDLILNKKHDITLLYQPLLIETKVVTRDSLRIAGVDIAAGAGEPLFLTYSFPFWRLSYSYRFLRGENWYVGGGLSLQLRNASIVFENADGTSAVVSQNLGPVPILKINGRYDFNNGMFIAGEIDGFYASSSFINGASFEFEGSILDASLRTGLRLARGMEIFINARYLGGSANGTTDEDALAWSEAGDSGLPFKTENYLSTATVSVGMSLK
jgi:hypothetical protein